MPEVIASLRAEGVELESVFLDRQADGLYLIYVMHAADFDRSRSVANTSVAPIELFHRAFAEACWGRRETLEVLIDFHRPH